MINILSTILQHSVFQGIAAVFVTVIVRKFTNSPPPFKLDRLWRDLAVGPDLLILAIIVLVGKWARVHDYVEAQTAAVGLAATDGERTAALVALGEANDIQFWAMLTAGCAAVTLLAVSIWIPTRGWRFPLKGPGKKKADLLPVMTVPAVLAPFIAGVLILVATVFIVKAGTG